MKLKTLLAAVALTSFAASGVVTHDENHAGHGNHSGHENHSNQDNHSGHGDHAKKKAKLDISAAWTRATVKTAKVGGGYITIKNNGAHADRLVSGSADFAGQVQLHTMQLVDDIMRMRPLPNGIEIPAGGEVVLKPGGDHVMFMGLKEQLQEGETRTVTLVFEKAGEQTVTFKVNGLAAKGAGEHAGHGDDGGTHSGHGNHGDHGEKKKHGDHSGHSH